MAFAVPGDLDTPTGGYAYDKRIIAELRAAGWQVNAIDIGAEFPHPTAELRASAMEKLTAIPAGCPLVIDGLAFGVMPDEAAVLARRNPLVALVHHPLALETGLPPERALALRESERGALAHTRAVIVPSRAMATIVARDYGVPEGRITVVEPGVDRVAARALLPRHDATVRLLAVGSVVARKGHDVLVAALAGLTDLRWCLTIAGDASRDVAFAEPLAGDIERLGMQHRIVLAGTVSAAHLDKLFGEADVFVLSSHFEGYGMVFSEAVAHGLPVVATDVGAARDIVASDAGILVPSGDMAALREALRSVIVSGDLRRHMTEAAHNHAAHLPHWSESAETFARVLDQLS